MTSLITVAREIVKKKYIYVYDIIHTFKEIKREVRYEKVNLNISRRFHTADDGFHDTCGCQSSIWLPFFTSSSVFIIGNTSYTNETVFAVSQNGFYNRVKLGIKSQRSYLCGKLLSQAIIFNDLSARSDRSEVQPRTAFLPENNGRKFVETSSQRSLQIMCW